MKSLMEHPFSQLDRRIPELERLASPLLRSRAVQRLAGVTFLGILSPRFRRLIDSPLWPPTKSEPLDDGSRYDHSLGVALIALDLARRLEFSDRGQRYAVAWGLTHDIATWPLSHTSEPVFSTLTGISARNLRAGILLGSTDVPEQYHLAPILRDLDLDPSLLASLFERFGTPPDEELAILKQVVRSPLTPDSLEGMWRCGLVFGVSIRHPDEVVSSFIRHEGLVCLKRNSLPAAVEFWKGKSAIYERFINREDVIFWESACSIALQRCFFSLSLTESLELNEDELVGKVERVGMPSVSRVVRYKEPQDYIINGMLDALAPEPPVSELWKVLGREPVGVFNE